MKYLMYYNGINNVAMFHNNIILVTNTKGNKYILSKTKIWILKEYKQRYVELLSSNATYEEWLDFFVDVIKRKMSLLPNSVYKVLPRIEDQYFQLPHKIDFLRANIKSMEVLKYDQHIELKYASRLAEGLSKLKPIYKAYLNKLWKNDHDYEFVSRLDDIQTVYLNVLRAWRLLRKKYQQADCKWCF